MCRAGSKPSKGNICSGECIYLFYQHHQPLIPPTEGHKVLPIMSLGKIKYNKDPFCKVFVKKFV